MEQTLHELRSVEDLDRVLEESNGRPAMVFKHSLTCPISSRAFREFQAFIARGVPGVSLHLITVQTSREVSNEAAERLKVPHQSPQAILVVGGREIWNASHFEITAAALESVILSQVG